MADQNNRIKGLKIALVILAWGSELMEELDISIALKAVRATLITLISIMAYRYSKKYLNKLSGQDFTSKWLPFFLIFTTASILCFVSNYILLPAHNLTIDYLVNDITFLIFDMFVIFPILLVMVLSWAEYIFVKNKKNEIALANLLSLKRESELIHLKRQINPHFLFNALSNIYSIAYLQDKETPDKILQLSEMLRYAIYESDVDKISLDKEVKYIEQYIDFQKFKIRKKQRINFTYEGVQSDVFIAPMLLIPFVENAVKHSQISIEPHAWIKVKLSVMDNSIIFQIENTISTVPQPEILNNEGIGLENVKSRLKALYDSNFELEITQSETFLVDLKIMLPNE
jgi:sensor histidine kinase YesM